MATRDEKALHLSLGSQSGDERLRYRGYRGDFISPHRALLFSPSHAAKIIGSILLTVATLLIWYLALDFITAGWIWIIKALRAVCGLSGFTVPVVYELFGIQFQIPYLYTTSWLPNAVTWATGALLTAILIIASFLTPRAFVPGTYLLRIIAFFQLTAQVFFYFWPGAFPYEASGYVHGMLIVGMFLITLIPIVLAFTYYVYDFSLGRKVALTLMMMLHMIIMIPVQFFLHAYVLHYASLLYMPLLFFVFGLPLNVLVFIGFFAWGFSWENRLRAEGVQWKIRRRFV